MAEDKADPNLSMADFQAAAKERPEQFQQGIDVLRHVDSGLGGAERGVISAAQTATSPMELVDAAKSGFLNPEQAASWQQIAQRAGLENKYGQMAAAGLGVLTEPTLMRVPGLNAVSKEAKELKAGWTELSPSLQNLNKEGKLLIKEGLPASAGMGLQNAAKAESELMSAQKVNPKLQDAPGINNAFADLKARNEAKQFAVKSVKEELEAQPALARDNDYLRDRIKSLFNFHILQKNK